MPHRLFPPCVEDRLSRPREESGPNHRRNHNARPLEEILAEFRAARRALLRRVDDLDGSLLERTILHPRMKVPMRLVDHLYFVAEHDDHHLARMWEMVG